MLSNQLYFYSDYDCASLNLIYMIDSKASNLSIFLCSSIVGFLSNLQSKTALGFPLTHIQAPEW